MLKTRLSRAEASVQELQSELAETNHGLLALAMELGQRLDLRKAELRAAHSELAETNSELMQLTLELEGRVAERTAELLQAKENAEEANRAKDRFIAIMSHELRTPLTPVMAIMSALEEPEKRSLEFHAQMEVIRRNVELEARLIDDLLDLSRISRGEIELRLEVVDPHDCLQRALEACQSEIAARELELSLHLCEAGPFVRADPGRLQQVFWNLLKNAVKFTPERGTIRIRSSNGSGRFKVEISDNGIGIEPETLPRIFNAFEQAEQTRSRRFGGLGLGLNLARNVIERHQGCLTAFSHGKDKGATFTVELATVAHEGGGSPPPPAATIGRGHPCHILLVDDHPDTLRILSTLLRKSGYSITLADCVQGALKAAAREHFDLLVSDLGLPDGSGWDIMRRIKELYGIHGIAISGFGTEEDIAQSRSAGFDRHLIKPLNFDALRAAIREVAAP